MSNVWPWILQNSQIINSVPADAATIGEQTRPADPLSAVTPAAVAGAAAADADKKDGDEKVGLALPVGLGLGLAGLRARTGMKWLELFRMPWINHGITNYLCIALFFYSTAAALLPLGIGARVLANPISPLSPLNPVTGIPVAARLAALRARVAALVSASFQWHWYIHFNDHSWTVLGFRSNLVNLLIDEFFFLPFSLRFFFMISHSDSELESFEFSHSNEEAEKTEMKVNDLLLIL